MAWTAHYQSVVRSYLTQLVGPDRANPVADQALAELAAASGGSEPGVADVVAVRKVAQSAGLDALDAEVRRFGRRIARTSTGRRQCLAIARRLRNRAEGRITAGELDAFYRHLERCQACAGIAGRFEASEWYLQVELGPTKPSAVDRSATHAPGEVSSADRAPQPAHAAAEPEPEREVPSEPSHEPQPAPELSVERAHDSDPVFPPARNVDRPDVYPPTAPWPDSVSSPAGSPSPWPDRASTPPDWPVPWSEPDPAPQLAAQPTPTAVPLGGFGVQGPTLPTEPAPEGRLQGPAGPSLPPMPPAAFGSDAARPPRRVSRLVILIVVLVVVAGAGAAVVLLGRTKAPSSTPAVIQPVQKTTTNGAPGTQVPVVARVTRTPFEMAGLRLAVFLNGHEPWTAFARTTSAGPHKRWVLVTVRVRDLARSGFDPRALNYRLIAGNVTYFPDLSHGTARDPKEPPNPMAVGDLAQAELAYAVPTSASGLELAFDPTSGQHERVVVTLGE